MNQQSRTLLAIALTITLLTPTIIMPTLAADAPTKTLTDGGYYWQGDTLVSNSLLDPGETASLETADGDHIRNVTADGSGTLSITTGDLDAREYQLTQNGTVLAGFTLVAVDYSLELREVEVSESGEQETALIAVSSNKVPQDPVVSSSDIPNLEDRLEGSLEPAGDGFEITDFGRSSKVRIDVSGLDAGTYEVAVGDAVYDASDTLQLDLEDATRTPTRVPTDVTVEDGGTYWQGHVLELPAESVDDVNLWNKSGSYIMTLDTTDGAATFDTEDAPAGEYVVENASGDRILGFILEEQSLAAAYNASTGELTLSSNREDYNVTLYSDELNQSMLGAVVPDAVQADQGVVVAGGLETAVELNTSVLSAGNHTLEFAVGDTGATAGVELVVESDDGLRTDGGGTGEVQVASDGSGGYLGPPEEPE